MLNSIRLSILPVLAGVVVCGCATRPSDVPGAVEPGSVAKIEAMTRGGASSATGGSTTDQGQQMAVLPIRQWPEQRIPVVNSAEAIAIWFYPCKTQDGLAIRDGFWVHRIVKTFSWGLDDAMYQSSVPINVAADPGMVNTQQAVEQVRAIQVQQSFVDGITRSTLRSSSSTSPWTSAVEAVPRATGGGGQSSAPAQQRPAARSAPQTPRMAPTPAQQPAAMPAPPRDENAPIGDPNGPPGFSVPGGLPVVPGSK
jgi:hypothetical protein